METTLRPLSLGEILDRTAQLYRSNFVLFAGISAVYAGVMLVLSLIQIGVAELLRVEHMTKQLLWVPLVFVILILPLVFILAGAAMAANNRAVAWVNLGEPATIRGAYFSILPRLGRYLWLMTIATFVSYLPFVVLYAGYFALIFFYVRPAGVLTPNAAHANPQVLLLFGLASIALVLLSVPTLAYAVWMALRYSLAVPASVVENLKARQALRRSIELSKGSRGRIFVLGLLIAVIQIGLIMLTQVFFIVATFKHHAPLAAWLQAVQQIVGFFTNTFIGPMYATGLTLFYYDQRVRKEGFDIEWMMQAAGLTVPAPAPAADPAESLPAPPLEDQIQPETQVDAAQAEPVSPTDPAPPYPSAPSPENHDPGSAHE